jgi:hypothetical protein
MNLSYIVVVVISLALSAHVIRTGRSYLWILPIMFFPVIGWAAYFLFAILPDAMGSRAARNLAGGVVKVADPGRGFREKKRQVELVGSADAKRALAEEFVNRGFFSDAIELYKSAMTGPLAEEPALIHGLARAQLAMGDGAAAQAGFEHLRAIDPVAFDEKARLDYARSLELQEKYEAATREYEAIVPIFSGQEARLRYGLMLKKLGKTERANELFRAVIDGMKGAPGYYRSAQRPWVSAAKAALKDN